MGQTSARHQHTPGTKSRDPVSINGFVPGAWSCAMLYPWGRGEAVTYGLDSICQYLSKFRRFGANLDLGDWLAGNPADWRVTTTFTHQLSFERRTLNNSTCVHTYLTARLRFGRYTTRFDRQSTSPQDGCFSCFDEYDPVRIPNGRRKGFLS